MIRLESLTKKYKQEYALKDVTFSIKEKEVLSIIGPSGSGKSTLLRIITGLETATKGHIYIDDTKLTQKNKHHLCSQIGLVFQQCHLFPHMNVINNLTYAPLINLKTTNEEANAKALDLLEYFGLQSKIHTMPNELSGGQKQRVAIIRAMMLDPKIIFLDEPTSALDPEVIKDVYESILSIKQQTTVVVVTHHLRFAQAVSDRVIFMDKGQILCDQSNDSFFEKPKSIRAQIFLKNVQGFM